MNPLPAVATEVGRRLGLGMGTVMAYGMQKRYSHTMGVQWQGRSGDMLAGSRAWRRRWCTTTMRRRLMRHRAGVASLRRQLTSITCHLTLGVGGSRGDLNTTVQCLPTCLAGIACHQTSPCSMAMGDTGGEGPQRFVSGVSSRFGTHE